MNKSNNTLTQSIASIWTPLVLTSYSVSEPDLLPFSLIYPVSLFLLGLLFALCKIFKNKIHEISIFTNTVTKNEA